MKRHNKIDSTNKLVESDNNGLLEVVKNFHIEPIQKSELLAEGFNKKDISIAENIAKRHTLIMANGIPNASETSADMIIEKNGLSKKLSDIMLNNFLSEVKEILLINKQFEKEHITDRSDISKKWVDRINSHAKYKIFRSYFDKVFKGVYKFSENPLDCPIRKLSEEDVRLQYEKIFDENLNSVKKEEINASNYRDSLIGATAIGLGSLGYIMMLDDFCPQAAVSVGIFTAAIELSILVTAVVGSRRGKEMDDKYIEALEREETQERESWKL